MFMGHIYRTLVVVEPIIGLAVAVLGLVLVRRNADPAVKMLAAWGVLWFLSGAWGLVASLRTVIATNPPRWVYSMSAALLVASHLFLLVTAVYALWRLWRASAKVDH